MSFLIWYQVDITAGESSVSVSNDVRTGGLVLDAEITVTMTEGAATDTFEVTLINLPTATADVIRAVQATAPVTVSIHLGYFDEPAGQGLVLVGRAMRVTGCVDADGYERTVLYGQEEAGYLLRNTPAAIAQASSTTALLFAIALAKQAGVGVAADSTLPGQLAGFTARAGSTLDALRSLAEQADAPLVVRDGEIRLGASVGTPTDVAPVPFDPDTNIVSLDSHGGEDTSGALSPPVRSTLSLTVLGHPRLRVGQVATVTGLNGVPTGPLRLSRVAHRFTISGGYTAEVDVIAAGPGVRAQITTGVQVVVDRWRDLVTRAHDDRPAVDVGEITTYNANGHRASMHYAQNPDPAVLAPSVGSPVDGGVDQHDKPIASVFAFDNTGLIVPVYPGMRALLAHNRGLVNDAVIAGFLWPDNPKLKRPPNQPGDYWLALPTALDEKQRPTGPGANDLIDGGGHRVIQTTGLHILVGADALPDVGTRPDPPTDSSIVIEHASGTTITVGPDGAVTINTDDKPITLTNGGVSLQLDGSTVAVS